MDYTYHTTSWRNDETALRQIREQVFLVEQQVPEADEWDDLDSTATHFLVRNSQQQAIACARLLIEHTSPTQLPSDQIIFHIGRVAVLKPFRNLGIGRNLMNYIINVCRSKNPNADIYLHAQTSRQTFYEHLHFTARGPIFMDANIPHIEMWYTP